MPGVGVTVKMLAKNECIHRKTSVFAAMYKFGHPCNVGGILSENERSHCMGVYLRI